jgi:hypothetical protein
MTQLAIRDLNLAEISSSEKAIVELNDRDQSSVVGGCNCAIVHGKDGTVVILCK